MENRARRMATALAQLVGKCVLVISALAAIGCHSKLPQGPVPADKSSIEDHVHKETTHAQGDANDQNESDGGAPTEIEYGVSVNGKPLLGYKYGRGSNTTLFFAGIHGDEPLSSQLLDRFRVEIATKFIDDTNHRIIVIPCANPDGLSAGSRTNARGVDLNRNFPASNWTSNARSDRYNPGPFPLSEPESEALLILIHSLKPDKVVSIHCPFGVLNYDGEQSRSLAEAMSTKNGYRIVSSLGYETPGSFGSWAGHDLGIIVVTLELRVESLERAWDKHKEALLAAISFTNRKSNRPDRQFDSPPVPQ